MFCAISGQIPEEPVVSKKTGHVFEKRLILKAIEADGKCPITGVELTKDDLIDIQSSLIAKPRPVASTSIPGLLSLLQGEWDSLMLESFTLKKQLHEVRQELSQALYQHEAACRVIARLIKERDEAKAALTTLQSIPVQTPEVSKQDTMEVETALPTPVIDEITKKCDSLLKTRSKTLKAKNHPDIEVLKTFTNKDSYTIHQVSSPAVNAVSTRITDKDIIMTGGQDKQVLLYSRSQSKVVRKLTGHTKPVSSVIYHPTQDIYMSASADNTVRVWVGDEKPTILRNHKSAVTDIDLHATMNYFVSSSMDNSWNFYDLNTLSLVYTGYGDENNNGFKCMKFHPDGALLAGACTNNIVNIYDMKTCQSIMSIQDEKLTDITSLAFSENGYSMALGSKTGIVQLWDLRKNECVKSFESESPIYSVKFDNIGTYIAIGSDKLNIKKVKSWEDVIEFTDNVKGYRSLSWADEASELIVGCGDRTIRTYSA